MNALLRAWGVEFFMQSMFWILTKKETALGAVVPTRMVPFCANKIQSYLIKEMGLWNIVLKARQQGLTTFMLLYRLLLNAITKRGVSCMLISQTTEYAQEHFEMIRRAHRYIGAVDPTLGDDVNALCVSLKANLLHTQYSNRRELVFDMLDSRVRIASAEVEEAGQGVTLSHIVASEYARWPGKPDETLSNVMGSLVPGGTLDKESTANMAVGPFYEEFLRAAENPEDSASKAFFFAWWESDEYQLDLTPEQAAELAADITAEELRMSRMFHQEMKPVAWNKAKYIPVGNITGGSA
jgi:hypothetical protein